MDQQTYLETISSIVWWSLLVIMLICILGIFSGYLIRKWDEWQKSRKRKPPKLMMIKTPRRFKSVMSMVRVTSKNKKFVKALDKIIKIKRKKYKK